MDPNQSDPNYSKHREKTALIKRRFVGISLFNVLMVSLIMIGLKIIIEQSRTYPGVLVKTKGSGMFYAQAYNVEAVFDDPNYTGEELIKAIELAYLRAGNNDIEGSEYYMSSGVASGIAQLYESNDATFGQRIALNPNPKFLQDQSSPTQLALLWEAQLFSRGLSGMQSSTIYIGTLFIKGNPSTFNPTGWVLFEISEISAETFYSAELRQQIDEKTKKDEE